MLRVAQEIYTRVLRAHREVYSKLAPLRERCTRLTKMEDFADIAYAMGKAYQYLDDLRKEVKGTKELCERLTCLVWAKLDKGDPVRTDYVIATPRIRMTAQVPKRSRDPEKFEALMRFLKIPEELWELEVVRPHWPSFLEYTSDRLERGLPLPDGIDPAAVYPVYGLTLRGKKAVEDGYEEPEKTPELGLLKVPGRTEETRVLKEKAEARVRRRRALAARLGFSTYEECREFMESSSR